MKRILLFAIMVFAMIGMGAQETDRTLLRKGNRLYGDSLFMKAEENYLKAIDKNPESVEGYYNLGNSYVGQQKPNEAVDAYRHAINMLEGKKKSLEESGTAKKSEIEAVKKELAQAYHNTGLVYHCSDEYDKAIEAYKQALRNNPKDDETRFNLMAAMNRKQQQQQNQDQNQDQQEQQQQQDQQQQENQDQQDQNQDQQEQPQPEKEDMSKENAEQLLQSAMEDEKEVQEKVQEKLMKAAQQKQLEKDW